MVFTRGERNAATFKLANHYKRMHLTETEVSVLCLSANQRNKPPQSNGEVIGIVQRVFVAHASSRET